MKTGYIYRPVKKYNCLIFFLFFFPDLFWSQSAPTCTCSLTDTTAIHVLKTDTSTYTLSSGKTLCIYMSGTFKGTVVNNGGTICNGGRFLPKSFTFTSGAIINNKIMKLKSALVLSGTKTLSNAISAVLTVDGGITLSGGVLNNAGIINTAGNLTNTSGTLDNQAIINCLSLSGSNPIVYHESALINTKNP